MIFVGFGFLMTFPKMHSWTGVGFNLLAGSIALQFTIFFQGMWENALSGHWWTDVPLNIKSLVYGDFGAAAVLISMGALLGKINAFQLMMMAVFETFFYCLNEAIGVSVF